jgi:branched-chain amino acid transport system substrate-binding protein
MKKSRSAALLTGLIGVSVLLGGCASGDSGDSGAGGETVKVGAVLELTGPFAQYGQQAKAGIEAALAAADEDGTKNIEVSYYDCGASKEACVNSARQAITADGVQAIIGPIVSLDLIPTMEVTASLGVPQLMVTVNKGLTDGKPNVFRFGNTEMVNNEAQAKYIADNIQPGQTVAILAAANDYGQEAAANLTQLLEDEYGITPAATETIQLSQPDYTPALLNIRKSDPAFVALFTQPAADAAAVLNGAQNIGLETQFIMDANPDLATVAGTSADGLVQAGAWFPSGTDQTQQDFIALATESADITLPSWISAMTHDATAALMEVVAEGDTTGADIVTGLTDLSGFEGIATSEGDFDDERTYIRQAAMAQLQGGQYTDVEP